ncbi:MAG: hypothetical protein ACYSSL_03220 [Planctomycetota bacterium]|jgi:hypothetical protein
MRSKVIRANAERIGEKTVPKEGLPPAFGRNVADIAGFLPCHNSCSLGQLADLTGDAEQLQPQGWDEEEKFAQNGGKKTQNGFSFVGNSV